MARGTEDELLGSVLAYLGARHNTGSPSYSEASQRLPDIRDFLLRDMRWEFAARMVRLNRIVTPTNRTKPDGMIDQAVPSKTTERYNFIYGIPNNIIRIWGIHNIGNPEENRGIVPDAQFVVTGANFQTGTVNTDLVTRLLMTSEAPHERTASNDVAYNATLRASDPESPDIGFDPNQDKMWVWVAYQETNPLAWDPIFAELVVVETALAVAFYANTNPQVLPYLARLRDNLYAMAMKVNGLEANPGLLLSRSGFLNPTVDAARLAGR